MTKGDISDRKRFPAREYRAEEKSGESGGFTLINKSVRGTRCANVFRDFVTRSRRERSCGWERDATSPPQPPLSTASLVRPSPRDSVSLTSFSPARTPGSIPAFYREVHEKICSPTSGNVEREVFKSLLVKSQLSSSVLSQVRRSIFVTLCPRFRHHFVFIYLCIYFRM